jgi:hypothetical protein
MDYNPISYRLGDAAVATADVTGLGKILAGVFLNKRRTGESQIYDNSGCLFVSCDCNSECMAHHPDLECESHQSGCGDNCPCEYHREWCGCYQFGAD